MTQSGPKVTESNVDVLIIGAGPAGHMAANWFARTGINARIIDKRSTKLFIGQADGLQCRMLEIFQSFGFADRAAKESNHMLEMSFWNPDADGKIVRGGRIPDTVVGISRFQQMVLHQGRIETWMQDAIKKWSNDTMHIERSRLPISMEIDESKIHDPEAYPVTVTVESLPEEDSTPEQFGSTIANGLFRQFGGDNDKDTHSDDAPKEIIHAKYVIGCDGAHSWVRKEIGYKMEGEQTDYIWGVLDAVPITDFPDIRNRCGIHSKDNGSIMIIPRENGLVRLYIQLKETPRDDATKTAEELANSAGESKNQEKGRVDRSKITPEFILANANKIFYPYKLDVTDIKWFTAYQIGQRVSTGFSKFDRIFIAGDACHTHSPKAGQGMNVSVMDTYNLGWKIAHVLKGLAKPDILATYDLERRKVAHELINFDYKLSRMFSGKPAVEGSDETGVSMVDFRKAFALGNEFASGTTVDYASSELVSKPKQAIDDESKFISPLATNCPIGRRFDSAKVVNQTDAHPWHLVDQMRSDGRWRVVYFAGDIKKNPKLYEFMNKFGKYLDQKSTFIKKYTPASAQIDSVIDILLVHATKRIDVEWDEFPTAFRPRDHKQRMNYWKIYSDEESYHEGHGKAYEKYGVNPDVGALVVVRPDGYVSSVLPASEEGIKGLENFFGQFMIEQSPSWASNGGFLLNKDLVEVDTYGNHDYGAPILAK